MSDEMDDWRRALLEYLTEHPPPDSPDDSKGIAAAACFQIEYLTPGGDGGSAWLHEGSAELSGETVACWKREGMIGRAYRSSRRELDDDDD